MLISHKDKLIYIAIKKTASGTMRKSLILAGAKNHVREFELNPHATALEIKTRLEKRGYAWNDYFKYTTTRNPWARYVSLYAYKNMKYENYKNCTDFSEWSEIEIKQGKINANFFKQHPNEVNAFFEVIKSSDCQSDYYEDSEGKCIVNFIGRLDHLEEDYHLVVNRVGLHQKTLLHENRSSHKPYQTYYTPELRDLVARKEHRVIAKMGYTFES